MRPMIFTVPQEVLRQTTECRHDFRCLSGSPASTCKVVPCKDKIVFYVGCDGKIDCPYCIPLDDASMCVCPTRTELYRRYGI